MPKPLKILHVTAELAPLMSTGGLAEVANALPLALYEAGHDVRIALPRYRSIPDENVGRAYCMCEADFGHKKEFGALRIAELPESKIPLYMIEHEGYFGRPSPYTDGAYEYQDNAERFCFFCMAVLNAIPQLDWAPDVIHCHDWHTAMIPVYLRAKLNAHPAWRDTPTVLTLHNLAFQGRYGVDKLQQTGLEGVFIAQDMEYHGDINLLKAGLLHATKISTVSPRYAQEIQTVDYGEGLDGVLRQRRNDLTGILNGVNYKVWNPETDAHIPVRFSRKDISGKADCKRALQEKMGLPQDADIPLFGIVSRLSAQKGIDLVIETLPALFAHPAQVVVLGTGERWLEERLRAAVAQWPDRIAVSFVFNRELSHWIQAGSDFLLMPSRFEPCGLSQMFAMAYGTIPVVRRTGGLADSVNDWNVVHRKNGTATGVCFVPRTSQALARALDRALELYSDKNELAIMRETAMRANFSWNRSSCAYIHLYEEAIASVRQAAPLYVGS